MKPTRHATGCTIDALVASTCRLLSGLSGHTYFFDPNVGCFKSNTGGFAFWLDAFLSKTYPKYKRTQIEIAKVLPALEARKHWGNAFKYV